MILLIAPVTAWTILLAYALLARRYGALSLLTDPWVTNMLLVMTVTMLLWSLYEMSFFGAMLNYRP